MSDHLRFLIILVASWINRDQQKIIDCQCSIASRRFEYTRSGAKAIGYVSPISKGAG